MATDKPITTEEDIWASSAPPEDVTEPTQPEKEAGWLFGQKPTHQSHNWMFQVTTQLAVHLNQNGIPQWDSFTQYNQGAITNEAGDIYQALVANQNILPSGDDGTTWVRWDPTTQKHEQGGIVWSSTTNYNMYDISVENGNAYIALTKISISFHLLTPATGRKWMMYLFTMIGMLMQLVIL